MNEAFLRTQMLLGADALDKLSRCHVIVFGLGGVGSYAAECLARSGVGELTLVDQDTLSLTNINRQLYALHSTVGQYKAEAAARGIAGDRFEFQMLYGIRRELQADLVRRGYRMRVYVPYGTHWYPYFMRRLAERPANLGFFARNLIRR